MARELVILLIDDSPDDRLLVARELHKAFPHAELRHIVEREQLDAALRDDRFDVVITDYRLRWAVGTEIVRLVKERRPDCPVIMFTATGSQEIAVEAMKAGLDDYVIKSPKHYLRLSSAVRNALDRDEIRRRAVRSETRLQSLLERLNVGVLRTSLEGRLVDANPAFLRLFGATSVEQATEAAGVAQFLAAVAEARGELEQAGDTVEHELALTGDEGAQRWLMVSQTRARVNGDEVIDALVEDVTEARHSADEVRRLNGTLEERVARRTAELEEVNQALETFSFSVSHDLREPLRTIQAYVQAIRESGGAALPEEVATYFGRIDAMAQRMETMISDLLDFSRLAREELTLDPTPLRAPLEEALASVAHDVQARGARIRIADPLPEVCAHPPTLALVLTNLLANAVKFVPDDRPPDVVVTAVKIGDVVRCEVRDNGIGVPPEHRDRIFEVFQRLHGEETYPGTGIGLAVVRKAVERMKGRVGVSSEPGHGSTFWMELPAPRT